MSKRDADAVRLGCDPEAQLIQIVRKSEQNVVEARNYLENSGSTPVGWGLDGCPTIAELRTKKGGSKDAIELVNEIKSYMPALMTKLPPDIKIVAGSATGYKYGGSWKPTGGHIHFGLKNFTSHAIKEYVNVLDYCLMLPLMFLEDPKRASIRRAQTSYGNLYNSVNQNIGGGDAYREPGYGFEYRPPSSWLVTEHFTRQILSLAHTIVYDLVLGKELPAFSEVFKGKDALKNACEAHRDGKRELFKAHLGKIYKAIKGCALYETKYHTDLTSLFGLLNVFADEDKSWREDDCMLTGWGFPRDYSAFLVPDPKFAVCGSAGDPGLDAVLKKLSKKRYSKSVYIYGLADKYGVNFSLFGDFKNDNIDSEYIGECHETRIPAHMYACWVGVAKDVRTNADAGWIADQIESFLHKIEVRG